MLFPRVPFVLLKPFVWPLFLPFPWALLAFPPSLPVACRRKRLIFAMGQCIGYASVGTSWVGKKFAARPMWPSSKLETIKKECFKGDIKAVIGCLSRFMSSSFSRCDSTSQEMFQATFWDHHCSRSNSIQTDAIMSVATFMSQLHHGPKRCTVHEMCHPTLILEFW